MALSILIVLLVVLQTSKAMVNFTHTNQNLTFMFVTSFGQFGLNSSGVIPAVEFALERINNESEILPGYNLVFDHVRDSQCQHIRALDVFFDGIQVDPVEIAVIGCGCSVATGPVAEISHRWYIPQLSYVSGLPPLSDRTAFPGFFQNVPQFEMVTQSLHSLMDHFKWRRIAFLTQDELPFTRAELAFRLELEPYNITVENNLFETFDDPVVAITNLFIEKDDYRVFILNCYPEPARRIICEAARRGYTYPRYAWVIYDWYPQGWWDIKTVGESSYCESEELMQVLERSITLRWHPPFDQENNVSTDTGITPQEFENEYMLRASADGFSSVDSASSVFDVLWVLAYALNNTMTMVLEGDVSETGCSDLPGSLVNLEDFDHRNKLMGCVIWWNLQNTNFTGVSGPIRYDVNRTRISNRVVLQQYLIDMNGDLIRQRFAHLDRTENYTLVFESGFNDEKVFPDGIPLDGTILNITNTFETELVVVFDILATFGIAFVVGCFVFNLVFRNKKIMKISSPSLNFFIILGALFMYSSIYFYLLPTLNTEIVLTGCITWLFTIGYSLAFGAVLSKMWRIYQIFHNPKPKKKILKDWHLVTSTLLVTAISVVLLTLEAGVPQLRGEVTREKDSEHPRSRTEDLDIRQDFYVLVCYETSSPSFFWRIFIFSYLAILQLLGIVLSFQTRKVKYTGLRDSKFIAFIIYISSIVVVVLALVTFSLRTYINIGTAIFLTGYFVVTTIFLALIFIPKMVLLYKDPNGSSITDNTINHSVNASIRDTALKLNNFPSQLPRSGSDAQAFSVDISVERSQRDLLNH